MSGYLTTALDHKATSGKASFEAKISLTLFLKGMSESFYATKNRWCVLESKPQGTKSITSENRIRKKVKSRFRIRVWNRFSSIPAWIRPSLLTTEVVAVITTLALQCM